MTFTNRLIQLSIITFLLILGSAFKPFTSRYENKYTFEKIELIQTDSNGRKEWHIDSPKASFETDYNIIRATESNVIIYRKNSPKYEIIGNSLTSINNSNLVLIEGDIGIVILDRLNESQKKTRRLRKTSDYEEDLGVYKGDSLIWDIVNSEITIHEFPNNFNHKNGSNTAKYKCRLDYGCSYLK